MLRNLPLSANMGLWVRSENKAATFSVEESIIPVPQEGQTSSFKSEIHADFFLF
jgi:hypothetical protein